MVSALHRRIRARLLRDADPERKASYERYFKGAVPFYGLPKPVVAHVERELRAEWRALSVDEQVQLGLALLGAKHMEERQIGIAILTPIAKRRPDTLLDALEPVFDDAVHDWASCDMICGRVLRPFVVGSKAARARIVGWSLHPSVWRQRASAVAFVNEARNGALTAEILIVAARIVQSRERFVQLGCGWVLRELFLAEPLVVTRFIEDHAASFSREGLRYAVEKMPPQEQARLLALHAAVAPGRRRAPASDAAAGAAKRPPPARASTTTARPLARSTTTTTARARARPARGGARGPTR